MFFNYFHLLEKLTNFLPCWITFPFHQVPNFALRKAPFIVSKKRRRYEISIIWYTYIFGTLFKYSFCGVNPVIFSSSIHIYVHSNTVTVSYNKFIAWRQMFNTGSPQLLLRVWPEFVHNLQTPLIMQAIWARTLHKWLGEG